MEQDIRDQFGASAQIALASADRLAGPIARAGRAIIETLGGGGKVLLCGNGGSASDALHFSGELLVRYEKERQACAGYCTGCRYRGLDRNRQRLRFHPGLFTTGRSPGSIR